MGIGRDESVTAQRTKAFRAYQDGDGFIPECVSSQTQNRAPIRLVRQTVSRLGP
jgi:hypothetical protein